MLNDLNWFSNLGFFSENTIIKESFERQSRYIFTTYTAILTSQFAVVLKFAYRK